MRSRFHGRGRSVTRRILLERRRVSASNDKVFAGSVPKTYERYLVPLIFEHYAADLAARLRARSPKSVLEVAAGTGVVTRWFKT